MDLAANLYKAKKASPSRAIGVRMAMPICDSVTFSQTPVETASPQTYGGQCVAWSACSDPTLCQYKIVLLCDTGNRM